MIIVSNTCELNSINEIYSVITKGSSIQMKCNPANLHHFSHYRQPCLVASVTFFSEEDFREGEPDLDCIFVLV